MNTLRLIIRTLRLYCFAFQSRNCYVKKSSILDQMKNEVNTYTDNSLRCGPHHRMLMLDASKLFGELLRIHTQRGHYKYDSKLSHISLNLYASFEFYSLSNCRYLPMLANFRSTHSYDVVALLSTRIHLASEKKNIFVVIADF